MSSPYDAMMARMMLAWGGQYGVDVIDDTDEHEPPAGHVWAKVVAPEATVVAGLEGNWTAEITALQEGEAVYGQFTKLELTSGSVHAYRMRTGQV